MDMSRRQLLAVAGLTGLQGVKSRVETSRKPIRITNCYGAGIGPAMSSAQIEYVASCDLCIGGLSLDYSDADQIKRTNANLVKIRSMNPKFKVVDYTSAPDAPSSTRNLPANAWLRYENGTIAAGWPGSAMLNLAHPDVIEWVAQKAIRHMKSVDIDGVFLDSMGAGFDAWECNLFGRKVLHFENEPGGNFSDLTWLNSTWRQAKLTLVRRVRYLVGPTAIVMANQPGHETAPSLNGVLLEDWVDSFLSGERTWKQLLDDCTWWHQHCVKPALTTLSCSSGVVPPYNAWKLPHARQDELLQKGKVQFSRMRLGLAAALLTDVYYSFDLNTRWRGEHWWYPEYDARLGPPEGEPKAQVDGTWQRRFRNGLVIANPTKSAATIHLRTPYTNVTTQQKDHQFNLASNDGLLLVS